MVLVSGNVVPCPRRLVRRAGDAIDHPVARRVGSMCRLLGGDGGVAVAVVAVAVNDALQVQFNQQTDIGGVQWYKPEGEPLVHAHVEPVAVGIPGDGLDANLNVGAQDLVPPEDGGDEAARIQGLGGLLDMVVGVVLVDKLGDAVGCVLANGLFAETGDAAQGVDELGIGEVVAADGSGLLVLGMGAESLDDLANFLCCEDKESVLVSSQ